MLFGKIIIKNILTKTTSVWIKFFRNKKFMKIKILCFYVDLKVLNNFFVRIDILERLFIKIMNLNNEKKNEIKLIPEMLNLLGCNKDNFLKLIKKMNYKSF